MSLKPKIHFQSKRNVRRAYTPRLDTDKANMVKRALRAVMTKRNKGWAFIDGYSDMRVALKCGVTPSQVGCVRRKHFGSMPLGRPRNDEKPQQLSLDARIERLERLFISMALRVDPSVSKYLER